MKPEIAMIIVALIAVALAAALATAFTLIVISVRAEDRRNLPDQAPSMTARAVRSLCGLRVCPTAALLAPPASPRRPA
jgi:hypothetical protein